MQEADTHSFTQKALLCTQDADIEEWMFEYIIIRISDILSHSSVFAYNISTEISILVLLKAVLYDVHESLQKKIKFADLAVVIDLFYYTCSVNERTMYLGMQVLLGMWKCRQFDTCVRLFDFTSGPSLTAIEVQYHSLFDLFLLVTKFLN